MTRPPLGDRLVATLLQEPALALARHEHEVPELAAMRRCPQPANHHSEGDVAAHTELALSAYADLDRQVRLYAGDALSAAGLHVVLPGPSLTAALAVLLHDVGKPLTIAGDEGTWTYYGHESVGADAAAALLDQLDVAAAARRAGVRVDCDTVVWLIRNHLFWLNTNIRTVTDRAVRKRFVDDPDRGDLLRVLNWCDVLGSRGADGRPHIETLVAAEARLQQTREKAARAAAAPRPVLDGRVVMDVLQIEGGPRVGAVLALVRARHADAAEARRWLAEHATRLRTEAVETLLREAR